MPEAERLFTFAKPTDTRCSLLKAIMIVTVTALLMAASGTGARTSIAGYAHGADRKMAALSASIRQNHLAHLYGAARRRSRACCHDHYGVVLSTMASSRRKPAPAGGGIGSLRRRVGGR